MTVQTVSDNTSLRRLWKRPCGRQRAVSYRPQWKPQAPRIVVYAADREREPRSETATEEGIDDGRPEILVAGVHDGEDTTRAGRLSEAERNAERTVKKVAATFAPRPSGKVKNPATPGTVLYDLFGYQAVVGAVVGGLLSFNVLFPSDQPSIAKLLGMWSIWMFSVPSLRARECTAEEKDVLNILFLLLPLLNVLLPFVWKSFPFVFTADGLACGLVYAWKMRWFQDDAPRDD